MLYLEGALPNLSPGCQALFERCGTMPVELSALFKRRSMGCPPVALCRCSGSKSRAAIQETRYVNFGAEGAHFPCEPLCRGARP
jgi:hypothetical protein